MSRQIAVTTRSICLDPIRAYRQRLADYKPRPKIQSRNPRPARKTAIQVPNRKAWPRIEGMSSCRVAAYTRLIETTNGSEYHICAVCARSICRVRCKAGDGIAGGVPEELWIRSQCHALVFLASPLSSSAGPEPIIGPPQASQIASTLSKPAIMVNTVPKSKNAPNL